MTCRIDHARGRRQLNFKKMEPQAYDSTPDQIKAMKLLVRQCRVVEEMHNMRR
jgi:hypothetical protein